MVEMGSPESLSFAPQASTRFLENGTKLSLVTTEKSLEEPSNDTAIHEAQHVVAAEVNGTDIVMTTINPEGDSLGRTLPSRMDAIAAIAAHAMGGRGTGHDRRVVRFMGHDESSVAGVARSILTKNVHKVKAVARELEKKRTIFGSEIKSVMQEADDDKRLGPKKSVDVYVKTPDGSEQKFTKDNIRNENIMVPGDWITFPVRQAEDELALAA